MPKVGEMRNSKYLKKEDVGEDGTLVTIRSIDKENIAMEGGAPEFKWTMSFREFAKPMILNNTNIQLCEKFLRSDDTDHWIGKQIVLYDDPTVSFGGELVGGIRVRRATAGAKPPAPAPRTTAPAPWDEDAGFPEE